MQCRCSKYAQGFLAAGRILGLGISLFLLIFVVGEATSDIIENGWGTFTPDAAWLAVLLLAGLAGALLSWWHEKPASIILLLVSIGLGIHIAFYAGRNHFLAWLMVGFPFLLTAALLAVGWWLERRGKGLVKTK
jgi:hypothetical protein